MTKCVHGAIRIGPKCSAGNEQDPGRAERQERVAVINNADTDRAGGIIAAAGRDRDGLHVPRRGDVVSQSSGDLAALVQPRHMLLREPGRSQHLAGPGT